MPPALLDHPLRPDLPTKGRNTMTRRTIAILAAVAAIALVSQSRRPSPPHRSRIQASRRATCRAGIRIPTDSGAWGTTSTGTAAAESARRTPPGRGASRRCGTWRVRRSGSSSRASRSRRRRRSASRSHTRMSAGAWVQDDEEPFDTLRSGQPVAPHRRAGVGCEPRDRSTPTTSSRRRSTRSRASIRSRRAG